MKIDQKLRRAIQKEVRLILAPTHFKEIPLGDLFDSLKRHDCIVIQEDGTPWSGILCGREGTCLFRFTFEDELCENACLALQWYKMQSGKWEVTGYIT